MCGLFGFISQSEAVGPKRYVRLMRQAEHRGRDASGLILERNGTYVLRRAGIPIRSLSLKEQPWRSKFVLGHSRLVTHGMHENQPVEVGDVFVFHNGIVTNGDEIWPRLKTKRKMEIDTEIIAALISEELSVSQKLEDACRRVLSECKGICNCIVFVPKTGEVVLFSNNGSLFILDHPNWIAFASEKWVLDRLSSGAVRQISPGALEIFRVPALTIKPKADLVAGDQNLIPALISKHNEEALLEFPTFDFRRCTRCILPETMPFISFDKNGECNFCLNHVARNQPKPLGELESLLERYRKETGKRCIVPFSGGRDSSFALHVIVEELRLEPITFTYDWGMITDLGRRNVSRMCSQLGVENIVIAADIRKKRQYISKNLKAWLTNPNLGLLSLLTAGDKHFFRYLRYVQRTTGVSLNLWGVNPMETTHFKAGFLGVPPDFESKLVYRGGISAQLLYHRHRFAEMGKGKGFFNSSLYDTLSGEFWRSVSAKRDYHHVYDYWHWSEQEINSTLIELYEWETAPDTRTTWRIGDGTAAFYNYATYTLAGFTEHDTFRSNQIREGELTREEALRLVLEENQPRYSNIRWYLDVLGFDFQSTISTINRQPKLAS